MINALYAELRKLISVRSTYAMTGVGLAIVGFIALYGIGIKGGTGFGPDGLRMAVMGLAPIVATFGGIVAILLICHEYRYNTIYYTLTTTNNRLKVLFSKLLVIGVFGIFLALFTVAWVIAMTLLGMKMGGHYIGPQQVELFELIWKTVSFTVASVWMGLAIGFLSRSLVLAIVTFFMLPTLEAVLHNLLKISSNYLPNSVLGQVMQVAPPAGAFSPIKSLGMFTLFLVAGYIASAVLFVKRDAN